MLDLIPDGQTWDEVVTLAKAIERAGATIINTGIGWHEARVPTIATSVPRAAFAWVTRKLKGEVGIPLCTTNRINAPEVAERILADGDADMVSMARPLLADPEFVNKAAAGRAAEINTCIACNQACLDHAFEKEVASCLVNPRACHETELNYLPAANPKRIAVVGAGPAGLAAATVLAERGHAVQLFEAAGEIGGQFNMAKRIPGKEEFHETLRYFGRRLADLGVPVSLNTRVTAEQLVAGQLRRGRAGHRRHAAQPGHPGPGSSQRAVLRGRGPARQAGGPACRHRRRRRHRLRRRGVPGAGRPLTRRWTCRPGWRSGACRIRPRPGAGWPA